VCVYIHTHIHEKKIHKKHSKHGRALTVQEPERERDREKEREREREREREIQREKDGGRDR